MKTIDKLKKFFKKDELKNFDGGVPYNKGRKTYQAVSLDYLHKYVLRERISKKFIAKQLLQLCKDKVIRPIPCSYANGGDLVFIKHNNVFNYSIFVIKDDKVHSLREREGKILEQINKFNSYLDEK